VVIGQAEELSDGPARVPPAAGIQRVADGTDVDFPLTGTRGAILQARYLRVGHGPSAVWLAIAAPGLPRGYDYAVRVGECVHCRRRRLAIYSAIPDDQMGIWLLSGLTVPGAPGTILWVTVTRAVAGHQI